MLDRARSLLRHALVLPLGAALLVAVPAHAQLTPPPPPAAVSQSAELGERENEKKEVAAGLWRGDRVLHLGAPVAALEEYQHTLEQLMPGDRSRPDVLLRLALAEAVLGDCARALDHLAQVGMKGVRDDLAKAPARWGTYAQVEERCTR